MPTLQLYKDRRFNTIKIGKDEYKIPIEYTVEEAERVLELQIDQERIESQKLGDSMAEKKYQLKSFWDNVFAQLEIMFQRYQPELTASDLKKIISGDRALDILRFFDKYRKTKLAHQESKKKTKLATNILRDLRRMIAFMVVNGFSLLELRKLYLDEFHSYYAEMFYNLEQAEKAPEGTYAKIISDSKEVPADYTVNQLRRQMFKSLTNKKQ